MDHFTIGLIAAMPEEINPLLKRVGPYCKEKVDDFNLYRFSITGREMHLIESGMGPVRGAAAARTLIETTSPDLILNFGFAGAVTKGPSVGDLVVADRLLFYRNSVFSEQEGLAPIFTERINSLMELVSTKETFHVYRGTFITAAQITEKRGLADHLPAYSGYPVLEMETAAVARAAAEAKIPLMAIRAISDAADEELGFSLDEFTDQEMNIRIAKVLATVARKPWIIPQLLRLAGNAKKAGKNLARGVEAIVQAL